MGEIDEIVGHLGVAKATNGRKDIDDLLTNLCNELYFVSSVVACDDKIPPRVTTNFLDSQLPIWQKKSSAKGFSVFGKDLPSSMINLARAVTRRAERTSVMMNIAHELDIKIVDYLNKLSKILFYVALVEMKKNET